MESIFLNGGVIGKTMSFTDTEQYELVASSDPREVLVLNGNGTNGAQNNTFLDGSTNNFTITRNGNTTQGTFSPFSLPEGQWSNYFDGSGDYLSLADSDAFQLTGDFTIEAWVYQTSLKTVTIIGQWGGTAATTSFVFRIENTGKLGFAYDLGSGGLNATASTSSISLNTWTHIAWVRSGTTVWYYINGVQDATTNTISGAFRNAARNVFVGLYDTSVDTYFNGYMSNLRFVKGTALYTSNFTPPTAPLTAITNTSLLTCQSNRFKDNSSNNFTITRNGDVRVTPFSPFLPTAAYDPATNGGSGYFDGTGDYLTVADNAAFDFGSGNFTIECWVFHTGTYSGVLFGKRANIVPAYGPFQLWVNTNSTIAFLISFTGSSWGINTTSTATAQVGAWNHIALTRNGSSFTAWLNGVSVATGTSSSAVMVNSTALTIGAASADGAAPYTGYISNVRIVKGTAVYTSNFTPPTAPLTAIPNTSLLLNFTNAGIIDSTGKNNLETVGNAQIDTTTKKFGTGSMEFDGSGDYLILNSSTSDLFAFGTGDFTVEFWYYSNNSGIQQVLYDSRPSGTNGAYFAIYKTTGNIISTYVNNAQRLIGTTALASGTWYHIAVSRSGTSSRLFINGTQEGSTVSDTFSYLNGSSRPVIGCDGATLGGSALNGFIDDLRITKGVAKYTTNFTPPNEIKYGEPAGGSNNLKNSGIWLLQSVFDSLYEPNSIDIITDGLAIYLDSTNTASYPGSGNIWYDLSGNGRNFTWSSTSFTSGSPSYFSTSSRKCTGPASNSIGITNTSGYTVFVIALINSATQSSAFKFYKNNIDATSSGSRGIFSHLTWSDGNIYFDQGGCCNSDTRTNASAGTTNTWNIYTFRRQTNGSTRRIFKNASTLVTNTATAATIDLDSRGIDLGGTSEDTNWNARLGGFIVYNRELSDSEVTSVYNTIKTRYGIS